MYNGKKSSLGTSPSSLNPTQFAPVDPTTYVTEEFMGPALEAQLPTGVKDFLLTQAKFNQVFQGNIYDYYRDCNQTRMTPAINIYINPKSGSSSQSYYHEGVLKLDMTLPVELLFGRKALVGMQLINSLILLFRTSTVLGFVEPYCPGIIYLGFKFATDYSKLAKEKSQDAYVLEYNVSYRIDYMKYWEYCLNHGLSVQDPSQDIYPPVTEIGVNPVLT